MLQRRLQSSVVAPLSAIALAIVSLAVPAQAAPHPLRAGPPPASASARDTVAVGPHVVLGETSVDAPGFFSYVNLPYAGTVIAWAGTDSAHRINVMISADGLSYGHKLTLSESTVNRPAVFQMSKAAGGAVIVAWRGMDPNHSLNILFNVYGSRQKLTIGDNSFTSPAIAVFQGDLLLAWTGTDTNHSLNVRKIFLAPLRAGPKTTLPLASNASPNLTVKGLDSVFNCPSNVVLS